MSNMHGLLGSSSSVKCNSLALTSKKPKNVSNNSFEQVSMENGMLMILNLLLFMQSVCYVHSTRVGVTCSEDFAMKPQTLRSFGVRTLLKVHIVKVVPHLAVSCDMEMCYNIRKKIV